VDKIAANFPTMLMHLMMSKYTETFCAIDQLNKDIQLERTGF
jgi:hypothetical protein